MRKALFLFFSSSAFMHQPAYKPGSVWKPMRFPQRPFIWGARYRTPQATNPGGKPENEP